MRVLGAHGEVTEEAWSYVKCTVCKFESETYPTQEFWSGTPFTAVHDEHPTEIVHFDIYYAFCSYDDWDMEDGVFEFDEILEIIREHEKQSHSG